MKKPFSPDDGQRKAVTRTIWGRDSPTASCCRHSERVALRSLNAYWRHVWARLAAGFSSAAVRLRRSVATLNSAGVLDLQVTGPGRLPPANGGKDAQNPDFACRRSGSVGRWLRLRGPCHHGHVSGSQAAGQPIFTGREGRLRRTGMVLRQGRDPAMRPGLRLRELHGSPESAQASQGITPDTGFTAIAGRADSR
jgi:hypothetical protein